jgi:hypothetical protein
LKRQYYILLFFLEILTISRSKILFEIPLVKRQVAVNFFLHLR